jgi:hypothetical protein
MSNENKVPLNLYGIMDNELARMHSMFHAYLALPKEPMHYSSAHAYGAPSQHQLSDMSEIYKRIITMQDLLLQSLISHDKELQERIAELALTGKQDDSKR